MQAELRERQRLQLQQQQQQQAADAPPQAEGNLPGSQAPTSSSAWGAALGGDAAQHQLRLLASLCFGRTVAAAYLLPLMDLCVRTKLNIIGE